jgi:hypothetical protein
MATGANPLQPKMSSLFKLENLDYIALSFLHFELINQLF